MRAQLPSQPAASPDAARLRSWLKRHYSEEGTDHVRPFLAPFKWLNTHIGGLGNAPGAEVPHEHYVSGLPAPEWEARVAAGAQRHLRIFRQPNVDPSQSLVRDTRPIREQLLHKGDPAEHRHPRDAPLLYHPHPPQHA